MRTTTEPALTPPTATGVPGAPGAPRASGVRPQPGARPPVVLVPACNRLLGDPPHQSPYHVVGQKYVDAVRLAGCLPLVVPTARPDEWHTLLDLADGVLLTGSPSNVHPSHFGETVHDTALPLDTARDDWTLPLIRLAVARGQPLLGICRGTQEVNVALGGSLHQAVHEGQGPMGPHLDHRSPPDEPTDVQYSLAHPAELTPGGQLAGLLPSLQIEVNSLHGQAVNRLAPGLRVEARAPDGVIEAFSGTGPGFLLCLQWHPEWRAADNPVSMALLRAFGQACADWQLRQRSLVAA